MRRMITGEQITKINKLNQVDANPEAEATELLDTVQIGDTVYNLAGGVKSVNGQIGHVVLTASDIKADDQTTIQENIDRIDADITNVSNALDEEVTTSTTKINEIVTEISSLNDAIVTEQQTRSDEIARVEGEVTAVANDLSNHTGDSIIHVTASDKETWSNKVNQEQIADMATKNDLTNYVDLSTAQNIGGAKNFTAAPTVPNIKAQGSNESTIYGSTQIVHTFKDNTTLNLKYPSKTDNKTIATTDDIPTDYVDLSTEQTISGRKTFENGLLDIITSGNTGRALRLYTGGIGLYDNGTNNQRKAYLTLPRTTGTLALTSDVPANYVTTDTDQTITGKKTIKGLLDFKRYNDTIAFRIYNPSNDYVSLDGWKDVNGTPVKTSYKLPLYDTERYKTIATVDQIPTNYVTTDTDQAITGKKTFGTVYGKTGMIIGNESNLDNENMTVLPTGEIHLGTYRNYKSTILNLPKKSGTYTLVTNDDIADMVTIGSDQRITGRKLFDEGYIGITHNMDTGKAIKINSEGSIDIYDEGGIVNGISLCHLRFPRTVPTGTAWLATTDQIKTYYKHNITLGRTDNQNCIVQLELITTSSTKMDYAAVVAWMKENASGDTTAVGCTGFKLNSAGSITDVAIEAYKYSGGDYVRVNWYNPQKNTFSVQNTTKLIASSVKELK